MNRILYSREADEDLLRIYHYTRISFGLKQADAYTADIKRSIENMASFPFIGRSYTTDRGKALRRYAIGRHVVFYSLESQNIQIERILHEQMEFSSYLDQSSK